MSITADSRVATATHSLRRFLTERNPLSPDSFPAKATVFAVTFTLAIALVTITGIALFVALRYGAKTLQANEPRVSITAQIVMNVVVAAFVIWRLPVVARSSLNRLGIAVRPSLRILALGVAAGFVVLAVTDGLSICMQLVFGATPDATIAFVRQSHSVVFLFAIAAANVITTPLAEELFFRGLVFNALWSRWPLWAAAGLSGAIFGVAHFSAENLVPLAAGGVLLALIYARLRSIWASVIAHAVLNAAVVAFAILPMRQG
jgi:membrane protease YdiL (CAAX protease family)